MRALCTIALAVCVVTITCGQVDSLSVQQATQQSDCQATLSEAENKFLAGKFFEIPSLLQGCIDENAFSNEEQIRVYMILTQAYLLNDDPANAEESYLKLLAADPEYVASETVDPIDVVYLSKKFTTTPIFTPHLKIGPNISGQHILHHNNVASTPVVYDYTPLVGTTAGAGVEWNINDNIGIGGEVMFSYKTFRSSMSGLYVKDVLSVRNRQFWFDVPLYLRYAYNLGKVRPYGYAGYAANFLFAERLALEFTDYKENASGVATGEQAQLTGTVVGVLYKRHIVSGSLVFGGGVKYKWGKNFLLADLRYMGGLNNVVNQKTNAYDGKDTFGFSGDLPRYSNLGDTFRVNSLSLTLGFVRPLYDPRRVTKVKTKGVSKKISKD